MSEAAPDPTPSPTPAPDPTPTPAAPTSWLESLDADLRQEPTLGRYKSVSDLARGHLETKSALSKKGVVVPGKDAKPEAIAEFHRALGVPEKPEGYDLTGFEAPKEGWDPNLQSEALAAFHKAGAPPGVVKDVLSWYAQRQTQEMQAIQQKEAELATQWGEELKRKWGAAFEANLDLAERAFEQLFPGDLGKLVAAARLPGGGTLADHPGILDAIAKLGNERAEHQLLGDKEPRKFAKTPEEAMSEINKLKTNPEFLDALFKKNHPEYREANEKWLQLHRMAESQGA